jgi:hypothetical protein
MAVQEKSDAKIRLSSAPFFLIQPATTSTTKTSVSPA